MNLSETRTCKYLDDEGFWLDIKPEDIRKEMYFMMFEPDGQPVRANSFGDVVFEAVSDSYYDKGILTIQVIE